MSTFCFVLTPVVVNLVFLCLIAALLLSFIRLVIGPSIPDRVVALDLIAAISVGICTVYAIETDQPGLLDVAIVLALISFLGTIAFAKYVERGAHDE